MFAADFQDVSRLADMKTCPKCSLLNPDTAVMCDCGQVFDAAAARGARAAGFRGRHETYPPGPSKGAKFGAGVLGYFVGALPLIMVAEYRAALGGGESGLLRGLGILTGIAGVLVALRLLERRHESLVARSRELTRK
jgi:hypothetical protein